jgi:hypothetical protein
MEVLHPRASFLFITVPIFFMGPTVIATLSLALLMTFGDGESFFFVISYVTASLIWTLSQGALGACAFLCVATLARYVSGEVPITLTNALNITAARTRKIRRLHNTSRPG